MVYKPTLESPSDRHPVPAFAAWVMLCDDKLGFEVGFISCGFGVQKHRHYRAAGSRLTVSGDNAPAIHLGQHPLQHKVKTLSPDYSMTV